MLDSKNLYSRLFTFQETVRFINVRKLEEKYPAFIPVRKALQKRLDKIKTLQPGLSRTNLSETKKHNRRNLSYAAWHVSNAVYCYAQITGNTALKNSINYSFSDFNRPVESTLIGRCRQVLNASKKIKNPEHFGLMPHMIEKLQKKLDEFIVYSEKPVASVKNRARAARLAENLLSQCLHIVQHQLDPLMIVVNQSERFLLSDYKIFRKICKPAGRKRKYVKKQKPKPIISVQPQIKSIKKQASTAIVKELSPVS